MIRIALVNFAVFMSFRFYDYTIVLKLVLLRLPRFFADTR